MSRADESLNRLREELKDLGDDAVEEDAVGDELLGRTLRHLQGADLHPTSVDLITSVTRNIDLPAGAEDRARARVQRATAMLREQTREAATLLREARQHARISDQEAAAALEVTPATLKRIEGGRGVGALLNKTPELVAAYVRRLGIDPPVILAALFVADQPGAVFGYTPRIEDEERGQLLESAGAERREGDRKWALAFLTSAAQRE
jgi:transcriptional regulator with XRE-family HTH domain